MANPADAFPDLIVAGGTYDPDLVVFAAAARQWIHPSLYGEKRGLKPATPGSGTQRPLQFSRHDAASRLAAVRCAEETTKKLRLADMASPLTMGESTIVAHNRQRPEHGRRHLMLTGTLRWRKGRPENGLDGARYRNDRGTGQAKTRRKGWASIATQSSCMKKFVDLAEMALPRCQRPPTRHLLPDPR